MAYAFLLSQEAIRSIIDIELKGLYRRIEALGYRLELTDDAKNFLATKGYDVQYGARPLKRALQNYLEDELSELLITTEMKPGNVISVSANTEKDKLVVTVK